MQQKTELMNYLTENNLKIDELGRVIIEDPAVLAEIHGALGAGDGYVGTLFNGGCSNGACN